MEQFLPAHKTPYSFGKKTATLIKFKNGVRVIGFEQGDKFDLRVLTVGGNLQRHGLGQKALIILRSKYSYIRVNDIYGHTLPFWLKMKESGLVNQLGTVKESEDTAC